jgi:hypothetical protein
VDFYASHVSSLICDIIFAQSCLPLNGQFCLTLVHQTYQL